MLEGLFGKFYRNGAFKTAPGFYPGILYLWMYIMKKIFVLSVRAVPVLFICMSLLGMSLLSSCKKGENPASAALQKVKQLVGSKDKNAAAPASDTLDKDTSYAFGMYMANFMNGQMGLHDAHLDYSAFMDGFKAYHEAKDTRLTTDQAMQKINAAFTQIQTQTDAKRKADGEKNIAEGAAYLEKNKTKAGVTTTASGLQYEVIKQGTGEKPKATDKVRVNYEGTLIDGTVFDSSYKRNQPAEFAVNGVIPGWSEGVQLMNVGSTYRFVIPSELAYGANGNQSIAPNATLIFKVELLDILPNTPAGAAPGTAVPGTAAPGAASK